MFKPFEQFRTTMFDKWCMDIDKSSFPLKEWYHKFVEGHAELFKLFDGQSRIYDVEIGTPASEFGLKKEDIAPIAKRLYDLLPGYWTQYGIDPFMGLRFPNIKNYDKFEGMKWGKHINHYMTRTNCPEAIASQVRKLLSELGTVWSNGEKKTESVYIELSIDPLCFMSMGHFGLDGDSCFRHGSVNQIHKMIIGQTPNTFIGFSLDKPTDPIRTLRFWGVLDINAKIGYANNFYGPPEVKTKTIFGIEKVFKYHLGENTDIIKGRMPISGVWTNKDGVAVLDRSYQGKLVVVPADSSGLDHYRSCYKCLTQTDKLNHTDNGYAYCDKCIAGANKCEYTGRLTFGNLVYARDGSDKEVLVSQITRDELFETCSLSGFLYPKDVMLPLANGGVASSVSININGYVKCPACNKYHKTQGNVCSLCEKAQAKKKVLAYA